MIHQAFSIRDLKAGTFTPPFFAPSPGEGERVFAKLARNEQTDIAKFAEDFQLYLVGTYDDATAAFQALQTPQHLINATQLKTQ